MTLQQFQPIVRRRALDEVVVRIRELIRMGQLSPGDKLPAERELAQQLKVSRPVLREALRTFENAGVIEFRKGRHGGAFISNGNTDLVGGYLSDMIGLGTISLGDLMEARVAIEEAVIRLAAERATEADFVAMEENTREAERLFEFGYLAEKTKKVIEFHSIVAAATRNDVLVMVMDSLCQAFDAFARLGSETTRDVFASRRKFVQALRERDVDAAIAEMRHNFVRVEHLYRNMPEGRFRQHANKVLGDADHVAMQDSQLSPSRED